jgi:hypothetical protein
MPLPTANRLPLTARGFAAQGRDASATRPPAQWGLTSFGMLNVSDPICALPTAARAARPYLMQVLAVGGWRRRKAARAVRGPAPASRKSSRHLPPEAATRHPKRCISLYSILHTRYSRISLLHLCTGAPLRFAPLHCVSPALVCSGPPILAFASLANSSTCQPAS